MEAEIKTITIACDGNTTVELDELQDLQTYKILTDEAYLKAKTSILTLGFSFPIFLWVDSENKKWIIDAHQRKRTLLKLRESEGYTIPPLPACHIFAKDKLEAKKKILAQESQYGDITEEGLYDFMNEAGFELDPTELDSYIDIDEFDAEYHPDGGATTEDEPPAVNETEPAVSQLGEVYQLGRHKLMCGDATKIEDVEKLMQGQKADMVFTDPPYGVSYGDKNKFLNAIAPGNRIQENIDNDTKSVTEMKELWVSAFTNMNAVTKAGGSYYVCSPQGGELMMMMMSLLESGWELKQSIIWVKNNHVLGRSDYHYKHEPILYGWKEGAGHQYFGGSGQTTTWFIDRPNMSELHPTMKPIQLVAKAINNSSKGDDIVLDLFLGSGSTLIASEQANRDCYGMELDPKYCDVIRKRYGKFIGREDWQEATPLIVTPEIPDSPAIPLTTAP